MAIPSGNVRGPFVGAAKPPIKAAPTPRRPIGTGRAGPFSGLKI